MSNVKLPSEQSRSSTAATASPRDTGSIIASNNMNTGEPIAATTLEGITVGKNKRAAEVQDATACCTDSSNSSYSQQKHYRYQQQLRQQPSVKISLRDISDILDPFFGTSTALPSSRHRQQEQRGPHDNLAEAVGLTSNDHNDFVLFSGVENPHRGLSSSSSDGDESIGAAAEGSQAIQELIGAPSDSWIQSIWEMELEKNKMP